MEFLPEGVAASLEASPEKKKAFLKDFEALSDNDELLVLVNKEFHLDSAYAPSDLVDVTGKYPTNKKQIYLRTIILDDLNRMFSAARENNLNLLIVSAYRSYKVQEYVFKRWESSMGREEAMRISALPGASQHQLGTTIDFNSLKFAFENTPESIWLAKNSYKYGFILAYPKGMEELTGYKYEPWHYRYIGLQAAYIVYTYFDNNLELFLRFYRQVQLEKMKKNRENTQPADQPQK